MYLINKRLVFLVVGFLFVLFSTILNNGYSKQLVKADDPLGENVPGILKPFVKVSPLFYILGWIIVVYGISLRGKNLKPRLNRRTFIGFIAALFIVGSVVLRSFEETGDVTKEVAEIVNPIIVIGGWMLLGYVCSLKSHTSLGFKRLGKNKAIFGIGGSLLALTAVEFGVLRFERYNYITDGFGMALLTIGMICLSVSNSLYER